MCYKCTCTMLFSGRITLQLFALTEANEEHTCRALQTMLTGKVSHILMYQKGDYLTHTCCVV